MAVMKPALPDPLLAAGRLASPGVVEGTRTLSIAPVPEGDAVSVKYVVVVRLRRPMPRTAEFAPLPDTLTPLLEPMSDVRTVTVPFRLLTLRFGTPAPD